VERTILFPVDISLCPAIGRRVTAVFTSSLNLWLLEADKNRSVKNANEIRIIGICSLTL